MGAEAISDVDVAAVVVAAAVNADVTTVDSFLGQYLIREQ